MIELLQIIFVLAVFRFAFRIIFFEKKLILLLTTIFIFVISLFVYPIVLKQSGYFYATALKSRSFVQDISVIITIDAIIGILLSILLLRIFFKRSKLAKLNWFLILPDFLIVGFIAYAQQQIFYRFTGHNFFVITLELATALSLFIILLSFVINKIIPAKSAKYELNFIINIFILTAAIALNVYTSSYNTVNYHSSTEWQNTILLLSILIVGFIFGFVIYQFKKRRKSQ